MQTSASAHYPEAVKYSHEIVTKKRQKVKSKVETAIYHNKSSRNPTLSGLPAEYQQNQTADLLNAMPAIRGQNEFQCIL